MTYYIGTYRASALWRVFRLWRRFTGSHSTNGYQPSRFVDRIDEWLRKTAVSQLDKREGEP
jgi:hypothetical protein